MSSNTDGMGEAKAPHYEVRKQIGIGANSEVFDAVDHDTGEHVALKCIAMPEERSGSQYEAIVKEVNNQRRLRHPNVVPIINCFAEEDNVLIAMPLYACSVYRLLRLKYKNGLDDLHAIAKILKHTLLGLQYIHGSQMIHRDIKSSNILISSEGEVKVSDFGTSGSIRYPWNSRERKTFVGTVCWMAPEVLEQSGHCHRADIWSFGITALELMFGAAPTASFPPLKVMLVTLQEPPPTCEFYLKQDRWKNKKVPDCFKDFVKKCLRKTPKDRKSINKLLKHKFLTKYANNDYDLTQLFMPK